MKILFTSSVKVKMLKSYDYIAALCVLFIALSFFSVPMVLVNSMDQGEGIVERIELKRESGTSIKSPRSHVDYYEFYLKGSSNPFKCSKIDQIRCYGANNLIGKKVDIQINKKEGYNIIRHLSVDGVKVVETTDIGFFPFLLFIALSIITLIWSIWGFYITYIISDEKREEILGK